MKLLSRLALMTLILSNTPSAAGSVRVCPGSFDHAVRASGEYEGVPTVSCPTGIESGATPRIHAPAGQCRAEMTSDIERLLALHRSIRDGGLGVLRVPTIGSDTAQTAAGRFAPAGCDLG